MNEYIFTKLANAKNSSNAQMLRNVHKCKRVCLVCYDTLMMLLFLSVGPWRCCRKNSLKMKRGGANKERVTRGGRDSTITRWMERCRDGGERKRVNDGKEKGQQGRDCGNNTGLFHSIF